MVDKNVRFPVLVVLAVLTLVALLCAALTARGMASPMDTQYGCLYISEVGWQGTAASSADEYYEVHNLCDVVVPTNGWFLETVQQDGDVVTAAMPLDTITPIDTEPHLYERTDDTTISNVTADGIHGAGGTGGSLVGVFPNSDIVSFGIYSEDRSEYHVITMLEGEWPAGSSSTHASMQAAFDVNGNISWYTSNQAYGALDADGNPVLGTPGVQNIPNVPDPDTCGVLPASWEQDLQIVIYEDLSSRGEIVLDAELLGVDENGNLIETTGQVTIAHMPPSAQYPGWRPIDITWEEGTSNACIDALEMLRDASENILHGSPSNGGGQHPDWPYYSLWLNSILQFQKSGNLYGTYMPTVNK